MSRNQLLYVLGGVALVYLVLNRTQVADIAQTGVDDVTEVLTGWKSVQQGPVWVPVINQTEVQYGLPQDLLARIAYQESHFRPDIITGATVSPAGALGIMQLMPQYFPSVTVPRPFSTADTVAQISQAGAQLIALYNQFQDWGLAVAAYNDGAGNINSFLNGSHALPQETLDYVTAVLADVPLPTSMSV